MATDFEQDQINQATTEARKKNIDRSQIDELRAAALAKQQSNLQASAPQQPVPFVKPFDEPPGILQYLGERVGWNDPRRRLNREALMDYNRSNLEASREDAARRFQAQSGADKAILDDALKSQSETETYNKQLSRGDSQAVIAGQLRGITGAETGLNKLKASQEIDVRNTSAGTDAATQGVLGSLKDFNFKVAEAEKSREHDKNMATLRGTVQSILQAQATNDTVALQTLAQKFALDLQALNAQERIAFAKTQEGALAVAAAKAFGYDVEKLVLQGVLQKEQIAAQGDQQLRGLQASPIRAQAGDVILQGGKATSINSGGMDQLGNMLPPSISDITPKPKLNLSALLEAARAKKAGGLTVPTKPESALEVLNK